MIKIIVTALWRFFKDVHSGSKTESSKRLYGGIIIIALLTLMYFVALGLTPLDLWKGIEGMWEIALYIGSGLLGLGAISEIVQMATSNRNKKGGTNDHQ